MSLPKPKLDDKRFIQIAEETRALIPSRAPEWTDHNVHDPGITFIELFSWLVEMQQYRLNQVSDNSFRRFFGLIGLTLQPRRPAEVTICFDSPYGQSRLVPAGAKVLPVAVNDLPFETMDDFFLTPVQLRASEDPPRRSSLVAVITRAGDREVHQKLAEDSIAGHYEAFGTNPKIGDSLSLAFDKWFTDEKEIRLSIALFEEDLPHRVPLPPRECGFVPSAELRWEFYSAAGWGALGLIDDSTLRLSRSGEVIFTGTNKAHKLNGSYWIRATLVKESYEIPPRIMSIRTNGIRARQVETIVNEDLGMGLDTPDQTVQLKKAPVLIASEFNDDPFQAGEILDWQTLFLRLGKSEKLLPGPLDPHAKWVNHVKARLAQLDPQTVKILEDEKLSAKDFADLHRNADYIYQLTQAFKELLEDRKLDDQRVFKELSVSPEFAELRTQARGECVPTWRTRQVNRLLLQRLFPDLLLSDRVEIQSGIPMSKVEDDVKSWISWTQVADFSRSGPADLHYVLDPETGEIRFGNGLNGRVPQTTEHIRARFYRHTRGDAGNVTAGLKWSLSLPGGSKCPGGSPEPGVTGTNVIPGEGGALPESIDEAQLRSRKLFRTQQRVITAEDYESDTLRTPGLRVARAKAMPNHNPALPKISYPGDVTVVVVPAAAPGAIRPGLEPPSPSQGFRDTVSNFLNARRIVATNVHVVGPKWVPVGVSAQVFLRKDAPTEQTRKKLERTLNEFLNPYTGGPQHGKGWPFGRAVFPSEIYQLLAGDPEVEYAGDVALNRNDADQPLRLPATGLPYPGTHNLEIIPFELRAQTARATWSRARGGRCHG
jgi:hypothetical protein